MRRNIIISKCSLERRVLNSSLSAVVEILAVVAEPANLIPRLQMWLPDEHWRY